jgi:DNA-nicking Smr family endonuclease
VPAVPDIANENRVRRGTLAIGARLDLHGHSQASAETALIAFVRRSVAQQLAFVLVITGQGIPGHPDRGVLRRRLPEWVESDHLRPLVSGIAQARPEHGGAGAFYLRLRRPTR